MKIAALYDIHANLPALNALLEELQEVNPDLIVIGGDIVSGPRPVQTLERLYQIDHEVRFIRGNQDREVVMTFDGEPPNPDTQPHDPSLAWVAGQLSPAHRDFLAQLPGEIIIHLEGRGEMLFCHATPRSDEEIFTPVTPEERLTAMFSGVQQRTVICGHTHIQFERLAGGCHILNAGSVGMPFADRPGAYWLLLTSHGHEFRCTAYELEAASNTITASSDPHAHEFAEKNVLRVPTTAEAIEMLERMAAPQ